MQNKLSTLKNILVHIVVLTVVFVVAVVAFSKFINQTTPSTAEVMENSTFPLVYMQNKGVNYNCLHGYAKEMDVNYIRDTVTVLSDDHKLEIQIQPFDTNVESVSYEVLTLDGSQSLENTKVTKLEEENNYINAVLQIQNNMLLEQEYILKLQVTAGGRDIYFYTRLLLEDGLHLESYLDFVSGFYEKCVNKTDQTSLGTVVEPDETTGEAKTLATMDIHDSVSQLMWGDLNPQMYYKPTPSLVDINGTTASFVLNYRISAVNAEGAVEIYNVEEFYRLRYTDTRVFLLDFTRNTQEIFDVDSQALQTEGINLGICDPDVEFSFDSKKQVLAFVQENELWAYRINGGKMTKVFGFPQEENMDYRDFYDQNNIKVLRVDNSGDLWFAVSGYMNRGKREGENGIGIFYYEEASSTVEEILFIRTMESYDTLKLDIDDLTYITDNQEDCYILLEGVVYRVDLVTGDYERVIDGLNNGCYVSSESNRYLSWLKEGERYDSKTLYTMDFETGTVWEANAGDDQRLRPICFMGEDLVYGQAYLSDINTENEGSEVFPMHQLKIVNEEGEEVKTYQPDGLYIMEVIQENNMLKLRRASSVAGIYTEASEDQIVSTDTEEDVEYGVTTQEDKVKQTEILLRVGTQIKENNPQVVTSKLLVFENARTIEIPANQDKEQLYYVYAGGKMESRWPTPAEAIRRADEKVGVVINNAKEFVWERGNKPESSKIKVENIPEIVKSGTMDVDTLEQQLGKDAVDLTGCTLEQVLYFVGQGKPVIAATPTGVVIITGYDDYGNTILLNPGETETYFYGPNDSKEMFEQAGNRFVSYLETEIS
ncbi:MAG: C39 family peptidase [Lachnospiraceae bacterium]|nr:C39 family peptidase [Lachnospiraceae bacterium]